MIAALSADLPPTWTWLAPVTAPLYALVLIGERPGPWTLAGGGLIIVAGLLLVLFGSAQSARAEERYA